MFEESSICPYTGLRSFTEEESLYFKGRDEHIEQATAQLQRNKFLMLTGASGDGKSSLVYAGIVPNARAGFLKSKYTQWLVADFRPERNPFKNLCAALARQLDIPNKETVESELQHGFSSLIDLYKNSRYFIDVDTEAWRQADDAARAAMKRGAANLVIIVDQFEEFFTNPENYQHGVPSPDSNLVLNVLLETARIALEEDMPVYIVFTMRSDYIGQCAAFRGLPEYIGFSQFFVPRLNRAELQQVIEEPALLSGNRITRRLTERLIHDITEGVDQLPILQHALNQIWHAASNGSEEMDLVHYAMVGGMPVSELPDEQVARFTQWFAALPAEIRACYHKPDLQNVLDTHTNKLYEQVGEYCVPVTRQTVSHDDAKAIIKTAFTCLTKIDQGRAVRNRMSLSEITNILGDNRFSIKEVGTVLNIFREPGNTFIRPFITDDPDSHEIKENDVLDITHESLIRNWEYLEDWATEEFSNYTIFLDFEQQLNRWVQSGKSGNFLLSIGPLTYFEDWFNKAKPNAWWIARYLPEDVAQDKKLTKAKQVLANAQEFLQRSARKHLVTRTVMRYGPRRMAAALALAALLTLTSFGIRDYFRRQNDYVLQSIKAQTLVLANKPRVSLEFSVPSINEQLMLGVLSIPEVAGAIKDQHQKIKVVIGIATQMVMQGRREPANEILQSLHLADSLLEALPPATGLKQMSERLGLLYDFSVTAGFAYYFNPDDTIQSMLKTNAARSAQMALQIFREQPQGFTNIQFLSLALGNGINYKMFTREEISELLNIISPLENAGRSAWLLDNYARDKVLIRGTQTYGIRYHGLYQDLAYLYAASGNHDKAVQCMDTILRYQENFYQSDYQTHAENATNVAAVFYTYGQEKSLPAFVNGYCTRKKTTPQEFYHRLVARMFIHWNDMSHVNFYSIAGGQIYSNLNLKLASDDMLSFFYDRWRDEISKLGSADERNFNLAVALKNESNMLAYRQEIRSEPPRSSLNDLYAAALGHYFKVSTQFLEQRISVVDAGASTITVPRKFLFVFPDYRVPFHPFEPRSLIQFYNSTSFIQYVLDHDLFDRLYENSNDLGYFEIWLKDYQVMMTSEDFFVHEAMSYPFMQQLTQKLEEATGNTTLDMNILYLHLSKIAFDKAEINQGIAYLEKVQLNLLLNAFQYVNLGFVNTYSLELTGIAMANLSENNRMDLAYRFALVFQKEVNRSSLYAFASQRVSLKGRADAVARQLLDSAQVEMHRVENPSEFQPNRHNVAIALMYLNASAHAEEAYRTIKNSPAKFDAIWRFARAHALDGNLYDALQQTPPQISSGDQGNFLESSLNGYNQHKGIPDEWKKFSDNILFAKRRFLPYIRE